MPYTPCSKKVSHLVFDNNFGKCGPIFKILSPVTRKKILYVYITKVSTSPAICRKSENVTDFDSSSTDCWHVREDTL